MTQQLTPRMTPDQASRLFLDRVETFDRAAASLGVADLANYYWYHTIDLPSGDLPGGLVTPGLYDYRETLPQFPFPADMHGMRVLDVGSASGFFAFEFAKRGAEVVSVELPSLYALDRFPGQNIQETIDKIGEMIVPKSVEKTAGSYLKKYTAEQLYFYMLEGPFKLAQKVLGLNITRCYSTVYELTQENTGGNFDLVFMGDILVHTLNPLQALAAVAPLCRGTFILAQLMAEGADGKPVMEYVGGAFKNSDEVSWWLPNKPCFLAILKKLGFATAEETGKHRGLLFPGGYEFERTILRAVR